MIVLLVVSLACAALPAGLFWMNLRLYIDPPPVDDAKLPAVSILIPARNEAAVIETAVTNALLSRGVEIEVVVMDDVAAVVELAAEGFR